MTTKLDLNTEEFLAKFNTLSPTEKKWFKMIKAQYGVAYIKAAPGVAKSAMLKSIATKLGWQYIDVRLSQKDETDVGVYPTIEKETIENLKDEEKKTVPYVKYAVPEWARKANKKPTLIHFEEINRASQPIRNAALQLLLERCIGEEFCFNDNVYMVASGNHGDADGTDVEEFDMALNNRLIHIKHDLELEEWIEQFANENVPPAIISYLRGKTSEFYKRGLDNDPAYATARSWDMLGRYITANYGMKSDPALWYKDICDVAANYIGKSAVGFAKYIEDMKSITIKDVLERYDEIAELLESLGRIKKSDLLNEIMTTITPDIQKLPKKKIENLIKYLDSLHEEELATFLTSLMDSISPKDWKENYNTGKSNIYAIQKKYINFYHKIKELQEKNKQMVIDQQNKEKAENND